MMMFVLLMQIFLRSILVHDDCRGYKLWADNIKLDYDDFRIQKDTTFLVFSSRAPVAATATKIDVCLEVWDDGKVRFLVINKMIKDESWAILRTPTVLKHEQLHFDISEIFARKIRHDLLSLQRDSISDYKKYEDVVKLRLTEKEKYQDLYDDETSHGLDANMQQQWAMKVKMELDDLKGFVSLNSQCTCNN